MWKIIIEHLGYVSIVEYRRMVEAYETERRRCTEQSQRIVQLECSRPSQTVTDPNPGTVRKFAERELKDVYISKKDGTYHFED